MFLGPKWNHRMQQIMLCLLCTGVFCFHVWLAFPGKLTLSESVMPLMGIKNGWYPVIISYALDMLYFIGGRHVYWMLFLNLVPLYVGTFLWATVVGKVVNFKSALLIPFLPILINNIFSKSFILCSTTISAHFLFLLCAFLAYIVVLKKQSKMILSLFLLMACIGCLTRHNAWIAMIPVAVYGFHFMVQNKKKMWLKDGFLICFLILFSVCVPQFLQTSISHPSSHLLLHGMAAACVPADDSSCFPGGWYEKGMDWTHLKETYQKNKYFADPLSVGWMPNRVFNNHLPAGLIFPYYVKAVFKHPVNYGWHGLGMLGQFLHLGNQSDRFVAYWEKSGITDTQRQRLKTVFPDAELNLTFSPIQRKILSFLPVYTLFIYPFYFYLFPVLCLLIGCLWSVKRYKSPLCALLILFAVDGILSAFFYSVFAPAVLYRYAYPVLISALCAGGTLALCVWDYVKQKKDVDYRE